MQKGGKATYKKAVAALCSRLDPGSKVVATQDFRHASQRETESVGDFVGRLEKTFRIAYGNDGMLPDTRDALLFSQLQEGLKYSLMESPAVSSATSYQGLCVAAKNEGRRQAALRKQRQYITILGVEMFKCVAAVARLHKKDFKPPDRTPLNYDRQPFRLDGRVYLDISFMHGQNNEESGIHQAGRARAPVAL